MRLLPQPGRAPFRTPVGRWASCTAPRAAKGTAIINHCTNMDNNLAGSAGRNSTASASASASAQPARRLRSPGCECEPETGDWLCRTRTNHSTLRGTRSRSVRIYEWPRAVITERSAGVPSVRTDTARRKRDRAEGNVAAANGRGTFALRVGHNAHGIHRLLRNAHAVLALAVSLLLR